MPKIDPATCPHDNVTSTFATGWICCDCRVRLLSLSCPIPLPLVERALAVVAPEALEAARHE